MITNTTSPETDLLIKSEIENNRLLKDQKMRNAAVSPLTGEKLQSFTGLKYFAVDLKYRVNATLIRADQSKTVELRLTNGKLQQFNEFGTLSFVFEGVSRKLTVLKNQNLPELADSSNLLFIPFKDLTSGNETNINGRYLTLGIPSNDQNIILDFNASFNPFNAYNDIFAGVIPQASNLLQITMISGERKYEDR